jgi:hypothetical protein
MHHAISARNGGNNGSWIKTRNFQSAAAPAGCDAFQVSLISQS